MYKKIILVAALLVLLSLYFLRRSNFTLGTMVNMVRSDKTTHTVGLNKRLDILITEVLKDSGFQKSELSNTQIIEVDGSKSVKLELFIQKKGGSDSWNDVEKIIAIDATLVNGVYRVNKVEDRNSRDHIPLSTIEPSEKYFDKNYASRIWNEQEQQWESLEKSWKI